MSNPLRILEVVQSLEKGGRTTRFSDTVAGLRDQKIIVVPLCFSKPESWVNIVDLQIINKQSGINWQLIFEIRKLLKDNKINLIHAHCEFSQLYASIAGFSCGVKTVATFHRSDVTKYQPSLTNTLIRLFVSHYVAVSQNRLSLLTENLKLPLNKCHVVHGGVVIDKKPTSETINKARAELKISPKQLVLLSLAHLGQIKGHQDTLTALSYIHQTSEAIHLYIAGDGADHEKKYLADLVSQLKIKEKVTFLGQVNNAPQWLKACDIFIQPSIEEAFGLVFVEAGAKAKPVIATMVGGIKEIIVSQETGLLVPPGSPQELKKALVLLINSKALRIQYGEQGYQRIAINFSLTNMINHYIEIFKGIVKDTRTANHCRAT
jgi:glycosyltransferase involved in cell wall biosynthesis